MGGCIQNNGAIEVNLHAVSMSHNQMMPNAIGNARSTCLVNGILGSTACIKINLDLATLSPDFQVIVIVGTGLSKHQVIDVMVGIEIHSRGIRVTLKPKRKSESISSIHMLHL